MTQDEFVEKWGQCCEYTTCSGSRQRVFKADLAAVLQGERERCAKIAEETVRDEWIDGIGWQTVTETVAAAIRGGA